MARRTSENAKFGVSSAVLDLARSTLASGLSEAGVEFVKEPDYLGKEEDDA